MGPFLFCLAIQPFLKEISSKVQSLTYMDDIYLVGIPQMMPEVISMLEHDLGSIGLRLNMGKSWSTGEVHGLQHNENPSVMKAPLSISESTVVPLSPKVVNTVKAIEKVSDTQIALLLLRQVNNSSFTYTLRTSHSLSTKDAVAELTRQVHKCLASILRCSVEDILKVADRIVMPLGPGLGFTSLESVAFSAFQASLLQATRLLNSLWTNTL